LLFTTFAERAMLRGIGGDCQVPIGAVTKIAEGMLTIRGVVLPPNGSQRIEAETAGTLDQAESLGMLLANQLRDRGAEKLLKNV